MVGADLADAMLAEARRKTPPELAERVRFETADASALPFPDASFDLVAHANMIPFFDELTRVLAPGGQAVFAFSLGAGTPIYVPPERLREELARRGFTEFAEFAPARAPRCLPARELAHKLRAQGRSRRGITGPDGLSFWVRASALVAFEHDVEAARFRLGDERFGFALILEAREVGLKAAAGIVAQA